MTKRLTAILCAGIVLSLAACAGSGGPRVSYSVGYGGFYGPSPWGYYRGPVYVGGGGVPDIPDIPDGPVAAPLPDFGMPDMGPGAGFADFGDFGDF
jgi:hypothetical protein